MSLQIDFIYSKACPNVEEAKSVLHEALRITDTPSSVVNEWETGRDELPAHCQGYGSPSLLVNGKEVTGVEPAEFNEGCAVYFRGEQVFGVPLVQEVTNAIRRDVLDETR